MGRFKARSLASALALMTLTAAAPALATEGGVFGGPIGGTDIRSAYLPPTAGVYGAVLAVPATASSLTDQTGAYSRTSNPSYYHSVAEAAALLLVYPIKPLGFTVASSFQAGVAQQSQALTVPGRGFVQGSFKTALFDSYTDLFFASRYIGLFGAQPGANSKLPYGLTMAFGLGAEVPVGYYRSPQIPSPGKNIFIIIPSVAFTYLTGPNLSIADGTEISARLFYENLSRNPTSLVQSGNLFDIDWAVTERAGNWQFGVAGAYAQQLNSDLSAANLQVQPFGNIYSRLSVGGVGAYDLPNQNGTLKLKALFPVATTNSYNTTVISVSYARKLF